MSLTTRSPTVGELTELARYTVTAGERILRGQRVDGVVRITDTPAGGTGRAFLVERDLQVDGYGAVQALITDYVAQAERLDEIPMAASVLERYLANLP